MTGISNARRSPGINEERGFIVVAVLWILGALSALILIYLSYVTNTAMVVAANSDRALNEALATAGIELAAYQLVSVAEQERSTSGNFDARIGANRISVSFQSETSRIDLNLAPKEVLAGLFTGFGARPSAAEIYAERIIGWRTPATDPNDAETSFYRTSGVAYIPRHAPFPQVDELWLVLGIPAQFVERALPFLTVFSNSASVNARDAAPQVLAALPNMSPERLQAILAQRGDRRFDDQSLAAAAGGSASAAPSKAYRVGVGVDFENGRRSGAEAVILLLEEGDEPYRVLSWRNVFDGDAGVQQAAVR